MNFSYPFIRRPVGTTLLAIGLLLAGAVAYRFLPVASLPTVEFPTIRVSASRPGADPGDHGGDGRGAAGAPARRDRRRHRDDLVEFARLDAASPCSSTSTRNIDGAARDVQAALNAALTDLPGDLPTLPTFRKANPAAAPILILALTSKTMPPSAIYDAADSVIAQRLAQVDGVAEVTVSGAEQPAIRVRVNPARARVDGPAHGGRAHRHRQRQRRRPARHVRRPRARRARIGTNDQLRSRADYKPIWWSRPPTAPSSGSSTIADGRAERAQQPLGRLVQPRSRRCC